MKKTFRKALSIALALVMTLTVAVFAMAAITVDDAKSIALKDAGFSEAEVVFVEAKEDREDKVFDIEFRVGNAEYDYAIATDGSIASFSYDSKLMAGAEKVLDKEAAKKIALDCFGKTEAEAKLIRIEYDKAENEYDVTYIVGSTEYEVTVSASDGAVLEYGYEALPSPASIFARIKAFFEAIIEYLRNLFTR